MSDNSVLRAHLEGEVKRLHGERKMGLIIGIIVVLAVFGYMTWISSVVSHWSKPQNLVMVASGIVESNLPDMERSAVAFVKTEAPKLARHIGQQVNREVPKLVRNMIEKTIDQYAGQLAKYAVAKYGEAFDAVVKGAHGDIERAVAENADQARVTLLVNAIQKQVETAQRNLNGGSLKNDPIFQKLEESHRALQNLDKRLQMMSKKGSKKRDRREQLTHRFLGSFWRYVQQQKPDVRIEDDPKKK